VKEDGENHEHTTREARRRPAIQAIYAPIVRDTVISFEEVPPTVEEMAGRIEAVSKTHVFLAAEDAGGLLGYAYSSQHRTRAAYQTSVDVTVYVAERAHRKGVGRALYERLLPETAARGFHAAFAGIALPNPGSIGLHEAVGFTCVGVYKEVGRKFGRFHDVGWWQKLL